MSFECIDLDSMTTETITALIDKLKYEVAKRQYEDVEKVYNEMHLGDAAGKWIYNETFHRYYRVKEIDIVNKFNQCIKIYCDKHAETSSRKNCIDMFDDNSYWSVWLLDNIRKLHLISYSDVSDILTNCF